MRPWELARLTDRQIVEIYFAPRDEGGAVEEPKGPRRELTKAEADEALMRLVKAFGGKPEDVKRVEIPDE